MRTEMNPDTSTIMVYWEELGLDRKRGFGFDLGAVVAEHRIEGIKL